MFNKEIDLLKKQLSNLAENVPLISSWIKSKLGGRKKYVWACIATLVMIFIVILFSQDTLIDKEKNTDTISTDILKHKISKSQPRMILEIENNETDNVTIVDSATLNVELIEKKINPRAEKIAQQAAQAQVEVYSNSNGILIAPEPNESQVENNVINEVTPETQSTLSSVEITTPQAIASEEDLLKLEATYEEELPEGEYIETSEYELPANPITSQKLKDMNIAIKRKPPYFGENPVIVVVIDDMGISRKRTKDISSLQAPITSSFLTYSKDLDAQIKVARESGHEIIVHVPMQAKSNLDTAPDVLTINMNAAEISTNLEAMLNKFTNIRGVNNHMGSLFTEHAEKLAPAMDVLRRRGLFFLDSKTSSKSVAKQVAADYAVAYAHRHVFLDNVNEKEYVLKQLALTERIARRNNYAIAIGHPKSATYLALKEWLPTLDKKEIKLMPLSEIVKELNPHISYLH